MAPVRHCLSESTPSSHTCNTRILNNPFGLIPFSSLCPITSLI